MSASDQPQWIRVLEIVAWPTSFLIAALSLGPVLSRMSLSAIPVRLEGGVSLDEIRVPVRVQAEEVLPVSGAVRVANSLPLQVEARPVRVNGPVSVSLPQAVDVKAPGPIPVVARSPVAVKAESPIPVAAPAPIPVSTGGPVTATVDVRSVLSPLKLDPTATVQVSGGLEIEKIVEPVRANIRGLLFPFRHPDRLEHTVDQSGGNEQEIQPTESRPVPRRS